MLPDGCLIHVGRKDFRVQIRGYSVILGEVEAALSELDSITTAAVIDLEDELGNKRLAAYLSVVGRSAPNVSELRRARYHLAPAHPKLHSRAILSNIAFCPERQDSPVEVHWLRFPL